MQGPPSSEASSSSSQSASVSSGNPYNGVRYAHWNAPAMGYQPPTPHQHAHSAAIPFYSYPQTNATPFVETLKSPEKHSEGKIRQPLEEPCGYFAWEKAFEKFFQSLHFTQTWRSFELDFLMLNPEWEKEQVPQALQTLISTLQSTLLHQAPKEDSEVDIMDVDKVSKEGPTFDERKIEHVHSSGPRPVRVHSSLNKEISAFIARSRARNDASNRTEFLQTLAEKKRKAAAESGDGVSPSTPEDFVSCARVDAKYVDRDSQMKYDVAKNEVGALTRTMRKETTGKTIDPSMLLDGNGASTQTPSASSPPPKSGTKRAFSLVDDQRATSTQYPALSERLDNIEKHLALRYVPSPPHTLLSRIKFIEDHIVWLEKHYPAWAALHLNQPNRGWPPPPRSTPVIVPPHLRIPTTTVKTEVDANGSIKNGAMGAVSNSTKGKKESSLHKAVMERLEVKRALSDMKSPTASGTETNDSVK